MIRRNRLSGKKLQRLLHIWYGFACMEESQFVNHSGVASRMIIDEVDSPCSLRMRDGGQPSWAALGE